MPFEDECPPGGSRRSSRSPACVRCIKRVAEVPGHELRCFVEAEHCDNDPPRRYGHCRRLDKPYEILDSCRELVQSHFEEIGVTDDPLRSYFNNYSTCESTSSSWITEITSRSIEVDRGRIKSSRMKLGAKSISSNATSSRKCLTRQKLPKPLP